MWSSSRPGTSAGYLRLCHFRPPLLEWPSYAAVEVALPHAPAPSSEEMELGGATRGRAALRLQTRGGDVQPEGVSHLGLLEGWVVVLVVGG